MKNIILLLALAGSLTHCKDTPKQDVNTTPSPTAQTSADEDPDGLKQIKGLLVQSGGRTGFIEYKKNTMYEITDQTNTIDKAYNQAAAPCAYMSETVYAVLTGKFTRTGSTGFQVFDIHKIDTMVGKNGENLASTGVPFEFWCHGYNPTWNIEISHYEGGVFYQNEGDGSAWFCPWGPPKIDGETWTYDVPEAKGSTGAMLIKFKKEKVTDPVTGKEFDYSVDVKVNGKTLKGYALKGIGKVLGPEGKE